jgi:hypothetical protein
VHSDDGSSANNAAFIAAANPAQIIHDADLILSLTKEVEGLREALEPSGATKAAYMGEFKFPMTRWDEDEHGESVESTFDVPVPWTTIKEIMAAIKARALSTSGRAET